MQLISIDIETYSSVSLAKAGVYRYATSDDFQLLLFSYAIDEGPVKVVDLTQGETIPKKLSLPCPSPKSSSQPLMPSLNGFACPPFLGND